MEIEPNGNIVQKSKEYNRTGEDYREAETFLKKWKKECMEEDKKPSKKSPAKTQDTLWTTELSAVYKDHVVMKGGQYQGKFTEALEQNRKQLLRRKGETWKKNMK